MTWLRILLVTLLITENLLIPFGYVYAQEEEPVITITYQTRDNETPQNTEYLNQINNARADDQTYDFYTLSGAVKTVRALPKGEEGKEYYHTGDGATGYLVIAYDRISGQSLAYRDWIAATTTNANGKFALPIEKTRSGVFLVILRPVEDTFKFITSYDVSSNFVNRARVRPENGLNIGVIELVDDPRDIEQQQDEIPDSVKIMDEEDYWSCGEEPSEFKYKHEKYTRTTDFTIRLTDTSFQGNTIYLYRDDAPAEEGSNSLQCILEEGENCPTDQVPLHEQESYKGTGKTGRNDSLALKSYRADNSALSFFQGVLNRFEPTQDAYSLPSCSEFLKCKYADSGDPNKSYYTCGYASLSLTGDTKRRIDIREIDPSVLETEACAESDGSIKTYMDLVDEGYEGLFENFLQEEDLSKRLTSQRMQNKATDSLENKCPEDDATCNIPITEGDEFSRITEFNEDTNDGFRGERLAAVNSTRMMPKENEKQRIYADTLTDDAPYRTFQIPYLGAGTSDQSVQIYEMGPFKGLCEVTDVVGSGTGEKIVKNESREGKLEELDISASGYLLTNALLSGTAAVGVPSGASARFYGDVIKYGLATFLENLFTRFIGQFLHRDVPPAESAANCLVSSEDNRKALGSVNLDSQGNPVDSPPAEYESIKELYGDNAVTYEDAEGKRTYYRYTQFTYEACEGQGKYKMPVTAEQLDEGNIDIKGNTPSQTMEMISDSMSISFKGTGEQRLLIGNADAELFEATGTEEGTKLFISKSIDTASTDTLDSLRFAATLPDGTKNVLGYNKAIVRLIDREARGRTDESSIFAGGGTGGGGGGTPVDVDADCAPVASFTAYKQCDPQWGDKLWGQPERGTLCESSCGPTSVSMVINKLTAINPEQAVNTYYQNIVNSKNGTYIDQNVSVLNSAGINAVNLGKCTAQDIASAICDSNKIIIALGNSCRDESCSSRGGHFILVTGVKNDEAGDYFTVLDPYYPNETQKFINVPEGYGTFMHYTEGAFDGYSCIVIDTSNLGE